MRAVTFQSMDRTSSPGWYSRTSENSMPCPLNTERYSPVKSEFTSPRVRSSSSFTCRRISGGTPFDFVDGARAASGAGDVIRLPASRAPPRSRALDFRQHPRDDHVARHLFGLGLEGGEHAMAQHVRRDRLHIVGGDERAAAQERVGARRL